jgi:predicted transglutaminase-like cysteine proteinase
VRPRGLEPPRVSPLPPQGSASTNSATTACRLRKRALNNRPIAQAQPLPRTTPPTPLWLTIIKQITKHLHRLVRLKRTRMKCGRCMVIPQQEIEWDVKMKINNAAGAAFLGLALLSTPAHSLEAASQQTQNIKSIAAKTFGQSLPPIGYVQFCARGEEECKFKGGKAERFAMSPENWNMLNQVNTYVNGKIKPESDKDLYHVAEMWAYPITAGDCEDYVLLKKRYLQSMGFGANGLLITVLLDEKGEGHAVLTVTTDNGDFILDNRRDEILRWDQTEYKFLKRQSQSDPKQWVSLQETKAQFLVSTKSK